MATHKHTHTCVVFIISVDAIALLILQPSHAYTLTYALSRVAFHLPTAYTKRKQLKLTRFRLQLHQIHTPIDQHCSPRFPLTTDHPESLGVGGLQVNHAVKLKRQHTVLLFG